jgi:hypothetical protein
MPEDDDVADEPDDDLMSRPRIQEMYDDEDEDEAEFDAGGTELEEEYVCILEKATAFFSYHFLGRKSTKKICKHLTPFFHRMPLNEERWLISFFPSWTAVRSLPPL